MTTEQRERARKLASELDRFIQLVVPEMHPERIIVFGSYARGEVHEWSDLDLVVVADTDLPFYDRLKQVILLVRPTVSMDIVVYTPAEWEHMKASRLFIREEIAKKGKVVYERSHNLPQLVGLLGESKFNGFSDLSDEIRLLDRFYMSARYPDVVPGALPGGLPTQQDAIEALDVARQVAAIITESLTTEHPEQEDVSP